MKKLPPMNALRAFEAAARHVNFTRAADELCVTHGAVSRHVALLEGWLGVQLFRRSASQLALTEMGRRYLAEISPSLTRIAEASEQLVRCGDRSLLRVNVPTTFAMRWLIPRLSDFQRISPDAEIELTSSTEPVDLQRNGHDIVVRSSRQLTAGACAVPFMTFSFAPVCRPELAQTLVDPRQLAALPLVSYKLQPMTWAQWFASVDCGDVEPRGVMAFEQMAFALQAANDGLGIALAPLALVADDLIAGRLSAPFGKFMLVEREYHVHYAAGRDDEPLIHRLCDWLVREGLTTERLIDACVTAPVGCAQAAFAA